MNSVLFELFFSHFPMKYPDIFLLTLRSTFLFLVLFSLDFTHCKNFLSVSLASVYFKLLLANNFYLHMGFCLFVCFLNYDFYCHSIWVCPFSVSSAKKTPQYPAGLFNHCHSVEQSSHVASPQRLLV